MGALLSSAKKSALPLILDVGVNGLAFGTFIAARPEEEQRLVSELWHDPFATLLDCDHSPCSWTELFDETALLVQEVGALLPTARLIASDGRVFGLVRVHHWCGNDPVREHISRVNIAELLKFLREGESSITLSKEAMKCVSTNPGGQFLSGHGWDIGEYGDFQSWTKLADATKIAAVNSEKRNP